MPQKTERNTVTIYITQCDTDEPPTWTVHDNHARDVFCTDEEYATEQAAETEAEARQGYYLVYGFAVKTVRE